MTDGFWSARPVLEHIRTFAQARMVSPWATLGVVLARITAATPPWMALPPAIGGYGSLNLFVGLIGASGSGKGAATAVAREAVDIAGGVFTVNVGSGEGLAHAYVKRERGELVRLNDSVLINIPEIDSLTSLSTRSSSTILPELRKAWSGEDLGFHYADPAKRLSVPAHTYRLSLVAGIQPQRAQALLQDADGGSPQRFLWVPAVDSDAPDQEPEEPQPWPWKWAQGHDRPFHANYNGLVPMAVVQEALDAIKDHRREQNRGNGDPLDGHRLQNRLKAAAALSLLDGRTDVDGQDWQLASVLIEQSDRTREAVERDLKQAAQEEGNRRAVAAGIHQFVAEEAHTQKVSERVGKLLIRHLPEAVGETINMARLKQHLPSRDRKHFEYACSVLAQRGLIQVVGPGYFVRGSGKWST